MYLPCLNLSLSKDLFRKIDKNSNKLFEKNIILIKK